MTHHLLRRTALAGLTLLGGVAAMSLIPSDIHAQSALPRVRFAAGANAAAITPAVDAFRADLGGANNGVGGSFAGGRREINWDGVPDNFASPNAMPADFFNKNSARGAVFTTPGKGFQVSADADNPTHTPVRFGNIDASYPHSFSVFSPERLFTPIGSRHMDVHFFVPGTDTRATVRGFGAVFTDVDRWGGAAIEYFNIHGHSLGTYIVPPSPNRGLSFVGVSFGDRPEQQVARVRIRSGSHALGHGVRDSWRVDVVAMDDFIYGEPQPLAVARR
jgi:hypothetical protein